MANILFFTMINTIQTSTTLSSFCLLWKFIVKRFYWYIYFGGISLNFFGGLGRSVSVSSRYPEVELLSHILELWFWIHETNNCKNMNSLQQLLMPLQYITLATFSLNFLKKIRNYFKLTEKLQQFITFICPLSQFIIFSPLITKKNLFILRYL